MQGAQCCVMARCDMPMLSLEPFGSARATEMHDKLIEVVRSIPDGSRLVRVAYVWPCFNKCGTMVRVDRQIFAQLESKQLLGVKCGNCLTPPASGASVLAA